VWRLPPAASALSDQQAAAQALGFGDLPRRCGQAVAGFLSGPVQVDGDFSVTGNKSAVVQFADGSHRRLCRIESPESWFEGFGTSVLADGRGQVDLDPAFAAAVHSGDYPCCSPSTTTPV
jgi:hypothetical protein